MTKQPLIRAMRGVKKDSLNLINGWVSKSNNQKLVRNLYLLTTSFESPISDQRTL